MTLRKSAARPKERWIALIAIVAGLTLVVGGLALASHPEASLLGSNFEIDDDANLKVDDASPSIDWANAGVTPINDFATGRNDNSYAGGAKEDDTCPGTTTGSIPNNKSDLLAWGVYEEEGSPGFLHLFWSRVNEPSGTTLMDFELNQSGTSCGNGVNKVRTVDDLLIEYRIEQGGARAEIKVREWTGSAWGPAQDLTAVAAAVGTINTTAIPSSDSSPLTGGVTLSPRTFGEASLDLDFVFDEGECRSFGSAFLKSRASDSFTSQLKDFILPASVQIDNCAGISLTKTDDADAALAGAEFTIYESDGDGDFEPGTDDPIAQDSEGADLVCTTDADGACSFDGVVFGEYWIDETVVPDGHDKASGLPEKFTIDSTTTKVLGPYVNPRDRGSILVAKQDGDGNPLAGASFAIDDDGDPATTDDQTAIPLVSGETALFCIDNLLFATYHVVETVVPDGYTGDGPMDHTVAAASTCAERVEADDSPDLTFTNERQPGAILVYKTTKDKSAESGVSPLAGVTFQVTDPADEDAVVGSDVTDANGFACIEGLEVGATYDVTETAVPDGYAVDSSKTAQITISEDATCEAILALEDPTSHADSTSMTNDPLSEIEITFRSLAGDGITVATEVSCTGPDSYASGEQGPLDDEESAVLTDLLEGTYECTIVVDP